MTTITKEWLQQTIAEFENTRDDIPFGLSDDDAKILIVLKQALAALTAEPVLYTMRGTNLDTDAVSTCKSVVDGWVEEWNQERKQGEPEYKTVPLYAAPPASEHERIRREHAEWSDATFGDVGPVGPLKHLSKEALEAAAEPEDLSEWADMQLLLWDAQRRAGITDKQITLAMVEKLAVNKKREWPEPKDGEPRLHIKEQPAPVVPEEKPKGLAGQIVSLLAHNIGDKFLAQKIWNACREAMLNQAQSVPEEIVGWVREEDGDACDPLYLCGAVSPANGKAYNSTYYPVKRAAAPVITDNGVMPDYEGVAMTQRECYRAGYEAGKAEQQKAQQNIPENIPGGLIEAVNDLLNHDGSRGCYNAIACGNARERIENWLAQRLRWEIQRDKNLSAGNSPVIPDGYALVPIVPTEDMVINGFESEPDPHFSDEKVWAEYEALSGCRRAARRAELCWAAMIKAAPKQEGNNG